MKPVLEHITTDAGKSFTAYRLTLPRFPFSWHYHPEWELTYITRGAGRRMVGDSYLPFGPGDLVLLGPDLPHTWESEYEDEDGVEAIVIQFPTQIWEQVLALPEFSSVKRSLAQAGQGLHFKRIPEAVLQRLHLLPSAPPTRRLLTLLEVLEGLASVEAVSLSSHLYSPLLGSVPIDRINSVCRFIQEQAHRPLPMAEVAAVSCLQPSAFCRFFKRATGKTFSNYLNEIRIGRVCMALQSGRDTIANTAFEAGFENLSYFNRTFKKRMGVSPRSYLKGPKLRVD